jgi:hypothetical protein
MQEMELTDRIDLLLGMNNCANGAYYQVYDYDEAISIINLRSESEMTTPFATEQSHLDLSRLLSDMNMEIERGNNTNVTNLLTRRGNVFPPDQVPQADASLHHRPSTYVHDPEGQPAQE